MGPAEEEVSPSSLRHPEEEPCPLECHDSTALSAQMSLSTTSVREDSGRDKEEEEVQQKGGIQT